MAIKAITHIRRLRGGSQAQLMVADDGHEYAIKFQGNPQTTRVLANEYLAGRLARMIKLINVPEPVIIHVDAETIRRYDISFQSPFPKWTLDEAGKHSCEHMRHSGDALETQVL